MRFKLDEHFDARLAALVAEGGHDVETFVREGLAGADDFWLEQAEAELAALP